MVEETKTMKTNNIDLLDDERSIYIICSGAGAGIQKRLWEIPGISKVLVGSEFPYGNSDELLGFKPNKYVCEKTAIEFAMKAYYKACKYGTNPIGLGLTASVASLVEHRGEHKICCAIMDNNGCKVYERVIEKGVGEIARLADGNLADMIGISALHGANGFTVVDEGQLLEIFMEHPLFLPDGRRESYEAGSIGSDLGVIFPGAFNPPHAGHFYLGDKYNATYSITIDSVHKGKISVADCLRRARGLAGRNVLFSLGDPLYIDKARNHPGETFIIGIDAYRRMMDIKWGVDIGEMLKEFGELGVKFLVSDREDDHLVAEDDIFKRVRIPAEYAWYSSTKIRENGESDTWVG